MINFISFSICETHFSMERGFRWKEPTSQAQSNGKGRMVSWRGWALEAAVVSWSEGEWREENGWPFDSGIPEARCGKTFPIHEKRANHRAPGFQRGDEVRKETSFQEFHPVPSEEPKSVSPLRHCGQEGGRAGDLPKSSQTVFARIFPPSQGTD